VSFSAAGSTGCSVSGSTVSVSDASGSCSITATMAGNNNFNAVTSAVLPVALLKAVQTISLTTAAPANAPYNSSFNVAATGGGSGNPVVITTTGVCSGGGNGSATITMTSGTGICTVKYNQAGNNNFNAAAEVMSYTSAQKIAQSTLTVGGPANLMFPNTATLTSSGGSGTGLVSFGAGSSTGCSISGSTLSVTNSLGTCSVTASKAGDSNYNPATSAAVTVPLIAWNISGFFQPVDMGSSVVNTIKGGSTVPLKFRVFAGSEEKKSTSDVKLIHQQQINCTGGLVEDAIEEFASGGTSLRYDTSGGQFIFNWQSPKGAGQCFEITMTSSDGNWIKATFKTK
jgi:hypothetical protein